MIAVLGMGNGAAGAGSLNVPTYVRMEDGSIIDGDGSKVNE